MSTIFQAVVAPPAAIASQSNASARNAALDRARTFITILVLIHHSVIAYTYFGHTDLQSFLGWDAVVIFNDSFFMAAMFLLSGLFVWPSLQRKGAGWFLIDRWWRLGLPYIVSVLILMPIAYYAITLRLTDESFADFYLRTITIGPWPSGPAWFVSVLLLFDVLAVILYRIAPAIVEATGLFWATGYARPTRAFVLFLVASNVAYVPAVMYFGASHWWVAGPVVAQASRLLLYLLYFFVGVGIGTVAFDRGLFSANGGLAQRWAVWLSVTIASYGALLLLITVRHNWLLDVNNPPAWWLLAYAIAFASYSAAQTINIVALFLRFRSQGASLLDPMRDSAYGIYLVHYIPVLWMQYAMHGLAFGPVMQVTAVIKALIVFAVTLAGSWAVIAAMRRLPGATRVL